MSKTRSSPPCPCETCVLTRKLDRVNRTLSKLRARLAQKRRAGENTILFPNPNPPLIGGKE